jgi:hypothetical protein
MLQWAIHAAHMEKIIKFLGDLDLRRNITLDFREIVGNSDWIHLA